MLPLTVKSGRLNILLIDDDPDEVSLVGEALKRAGAGDTVHGVSDGQQAIYVKEAYRLGANSYILKPKEVQEMTDTLQDVYRFWSMCEVPNLPVSC